MSHTKRRVSRPRSGPEWVVQDVSTYAYWRAGVDECAACGVDVALDDDHYGMELFRHRATQGKLGLERERFVFCSQACVDSWSH